MRKKQARVAIEELERQGFVTKEDGRWEMTEKGMQAMAPRKKGPERKHPDQKLWKDEENIIRFQHNEIIKYLFDAGKIDLNEIAFMPFPEEDRVQLAQLLGYSVVGFWDLPYVTEKDRDRTERKAKKLL